MRQEPSTSTTAAPTVMCTNCGGMLTGGTTTTLTSSRLSSQAAGDPVRVRVRCARNATRELSRRRPAYPRAVVGLRPGWHHNDLTVAAGAPAAAGDPFGYVFDAQEHSTSTISAPMDTCMSYGGMRSGWHWTRQRLRLPPPVRPRPASNPHGYVFIAARHPTRELSRHRLAISTSYGGTPMAGITAISPIATGAPANAPALPLGYMFAAQGTQHVNYLANRLPDLTKLVVARGILSSVSSRATTGIGVVLGGGLDQRRALLSPSSGDTQCEVVNEQLGRTRPLYQSQVRTTATNLDISIKRTSHTSGTSGFRKRPGLVRRLVRMH